MHSDDATTSPAVRIRPATADDAPRLAQLRWEFRAGTATAPHRGESQEVFVARCRAWMRERLADDASARRGSWYAWVAERGEEHDLVGQIWLQLIEKIPNPSSDEPEWHAYVSNLYVRPSARGGLGTRLLDACLTWLAGSPYAVHDIVLWPSPQSRSLYERHGFVVRDDLLVRPGRADARPERRH